MSDPVRYVIPTKVRNVFEHFTTTSTTKDKQTGEALSVRESDGWFVRLDTNVSIFLSRQKPDLKPGDEINLILEKRG